MMVPAKSKGSVSEKTRGTTVQVETAVKPLTADDIAAIQDLQRILLAGKKNPNVPPAYSEKVGDEKTVIFLSLFLPMNC